VILTGPIFPWSASSGRWQNSRFGVLVESSRIDLTEKAGALDLLIASNGRCGRMLSGGCLEGDMGEYARGV